MGRRRLTSVQLAWPDCSEGCPLNRRWVPSGAKRRTHNRGGTRRQSWTSARRTLSGPIGTRRSRGVSSDGATSDILRILASSPGPELMTFATVAGRSRHIARDCDHRLVERHILDAGYSRC